MFPERVSVPVPFLVRPPPEEEGCARRACEMVISLPVATSKVAPPDLM